MQRDTDRGAPAETAGEGFSKVELNYPKIWRTRLPAEETASTLVLG